MVHTNQHDSDGNAVINKSFDTESEDAEHGDEINTTAPEEVTEVDLIADASGENSAVGEQNLTEILGDTPEKEEPESM